MFDEWIGMEGLLDLIEKVTGKRIKPRTVRDWQRTKGFPRMQVTAFGKAFYVPQITQWFKRETKIVPLDRFSGA